MRDTKESRENRDKQSIPYLRRFPVRGWDVLVTVCEEPKLFKRLPEFEGWTRERHHRMALEYLTLARCTDTMYAALSTMMATTYGDGNGTLISGCYREHFPDAVKNDLRHLAHTATDYSSRSAAHWRASHRTLDSWRNYRDAMRAL